MKKLLVEIGECLFSIGVSFFRAWVVTMLWSWFVVGVFGAPPITIGVVFGVGVLYSVFMFNPYSDTFQKKETMQAAFERAAVSIIGLLAGWLIHLAC